MRLLTHASSPLFIRYRTTRTTSSACQSALALFGESTAVSHPSFILPIGTHCSLRTNIYLFAIQEWQKKLSGLKVAQLPWDPPPTPAIKEPTPVPSNAKPAPQTLPSNDNTIPSPPSQQLAPSAAPVKAENNNPAPYPSQAPPPQPYQAPSFQQGQPMTARDRAAMNLHQSFGQRAGPQIAQLQANQSRTPLQPSAPPTANYIKQEDSQHTFNGVEDYAPDIKPDPSIALKSGQTDGAGDSYHDWNTEYVQRKACAAAHGAEGDHLVRAHVMARQQDLEGGGLLQTLESRSMPRKSTPLKFKQLPGETPSHTTPNLTRSQGDATGDEDDDVDDEDAINSDLDDPDDLAANEEDGENTDQVMLCTYDKVQRVKNKWKCTLKDGVLRVEGNE